MNETTGPAGPSSALAELRKWWIVHVSGAVDQAEVTERRREDSRMSEHYLFMTAMSGGIAVLGLLLSSPAVVIGAMLLSPLMGPIMGLGFALAIGDWPWLKAALRTLLLGSAMAVLLCACLVFLSPIQGITSEIAARTRPNLFDLFVALFSALAGAYAMIRGKEGAIVGVAIATALMPPLAVVGYGLATWNWTVFSGALLLFVTNFITIALTAFGMARLYGFRANLSRGQSRVQSLMVLAVLLALAVPLGFALQRIAWEANAQRIVRSEIRAQFDAGSKLDTLTLDFAAAPVGIEAVVFTPVLRPEAEAGLARALAERLGEEVRLDLVQYEVGTAATAAERAQLSAAREQGERAASTRAQALAVRLALAAGVPESDVLIDEPRRRALVRARPLAGASLATYRALETRIAASEPDWRIELEPPPAALAMTIPAGDHGAAALALVQWAAQRSGRGVVLTGPAGEAEAAAEVLREGGIAVQIQGGSAPLRAGWAQEGE
ncbi:DUF389 domain-containing protein [Erythrobacter oryzae]|uniref:DUF389 domain-containing protein n=1 Tax=Erythrobacter oryzae TaxID=3019556 RepID=UPI002553535E|nr:DUF389 domain-containing protein [Erythrobacter sp. COR-2]